MAAQAEDSAVSNFREYLRIKTVQPNPDIEGAVAFLKRQAADIGLEYKIVEVVEGYPIVILTWEGTDPKLPSVVLNSHMDVVPVYAEHWKYDPFSAHMEDNGDIYARGTQDMKSVAIQYLEAIRRLKKAGKSFPRTIHLSFMPDEEIGGGNGMFEFVKTPFFKQMNIGFALDEGLASPDDTVTVFYCERSPWWLDVKFTGNPGHGSRFIENTAVAKLHNFMTTVLSYREAQKARLESDPSMALGDVTSVNITKLEGGVQANVVPMEVGLSVDIRVTPVDHELMESKVHSWVADSGEGAKLTWNLKKPKVPPTPVDSENPWWKAFQSSMDSMGLKIKCEIFSAGTDGSYLRIAGIPVLGFSPMPHTPILLHDHNEFLNREVFLKGITVYECLIPALASVTIET